MDIERLFTCYFSATGTTRTVVRRFGRVLENRIAVPLQEIDFTLPRARENTYSFGATDFVLFASPVYAGRIPNVLRPFIQGHLKGNGTPCAAVVLYGNRNYDDALLEWKQELTANGFCLIGAGAFIGEHAFSASLGAGRPDETDMERITQFADMLADRILNNLSQAPFQLPNEHEVGPYYTPRDRNGAAIDIRKVVPKVSPACTGCGRCVKLCPMGSINDEEVWRYKGICIKCGACVKSCPVQARYYDAPGYLYHKRELEEIYQDRREPEFWL